MHKIMKVERFIYINKWTYCIFIAVIEDHLTYNEYKFTWVKVLKSRKFKARQLYLVRFSLLVVSLQSSKVTQNITWCDRIS
jgi:hypothetical protein